MKRVFDYWMPDTDDHFERLITKRVNNGGPPEYQDDVRDEAYKYVTDFDVVVDAGANVGLWAKPLAKNCATALLPTATQSTIKSMTNG